MGGLKGQCCAGCTRSLHIQTAIVYILNTYLNLRMKYNNPYVLHKMNSVVCYCLLEYGLLG